MRAAGIREVKNRLSEFLRLVRNGESVLITDHERVVAQLSPPPSYLGMPYENTNAALERLQAQGLLRLANAEMASLYEPPLPKPSYSVDIKKELAAIRAQVIDFEDDDF
ncbi:MAG: type II toxin-antitoxin system Phd/YefM family antitoxin [Deltaproteobacteria bacterium]|nr:type II toxin-antitoxin system Phd/YefM family antitoxin [Deltaproteobacteria bacterium]